MTEQHDHVKDKFGTRYAVARKMHRGTIIYYVLALDANGDLAPQARTSVDVLKGKAAFVARAVLSPRRGSVTEVAVWPSYKRRGIGSALYRRIEADLGKPLLPSRIRSKAGKAFSASREQEGNQWTAER